MPNHAEFLCYHARSVGPCQLPPYRRPRPRWPSLRIASPSALVRRTSLEISTAWSPASTLLTGLAGFRTLAPGPAQAIVSSAVLACIDTTRPVVHPVKCPRRVPSRALLPAAPTTEHILCGQTIQPSRGPDTKRLPRWQRAARPEPGPARPTARLLSPHPRSPRPSSDCCGVTWASG